MMLFLASQSPRRRQLLALLGYDFETLTVDVPEQRVADESPSQYVSRVARQKALAGLASLAGRADAVVLGADTEVVFEGRVFGKPDNPAAAVEMLHCLSDQTHEVISVLWLVSGQHQASAICRSRVSFTTLSEAQIADYIRSGEPFGKAGAYAIQGRGGAFVAHLSGSHSGVMGLPMYETDRLLSDFGLKPVSAGAV